MSLILLVDDEELVREELGGLLEDEGHEVIRAADGQEAITLFREKNPDMVITDVRMPRRDGIELTKLIQQEDPLVPISVITGHGSEQLAIAALRAGATDFLKKPVDLDDLLAAVRRMQTRVPIRGASAKQPPGVRQIEQGSQFELINDPQLVPAIVDYLLKLSGVEATKPAFGDLSLALCEILVNAIEHGNLGLGYTDKSAELAAGNLDKWIDARRSEDPFSNRRVHVSIRRLGDELLLEIRDEGEGFDWQALPDPTNADALLEEHGRGVLLARLHVDALEFNECGNVVKLRKRIT